VCYPYRIDNRRENMFEKYYGRCINELVDNTHCCTTCTTHGMGCATTAPCVLRVLAQVSTRYLPVAVARSATLSRVNTAHYRFENFVTSCCKSIVYMVIHLGSFINVKFFYYVHNHLHYFHDTHQSINRMAGSSDALRKPSIFILVLA
jgi:hypothetical protein